MSTRTAPPLTRRQRRALERAQPGPQARAVRPASRSPFVVVTVAALALMAFVIGGLVVTSNSAAEAPTATIAEPPDTGMSRYADGEALGRADAPVVLEVYADYQCPWCGRFARETLPGLVRTFVAAGQLRIEERAIAFLGTTTPDESVDAAAAAACAAPAGKYWNFADYLMWNQSGENQGAFSRERLFGMADRVGLERGAFEACLNDPATRSAIERRTQEAFAAGIQSTPTFLVNGEQVAVSEFSELGPIIQARVDAASGS